MVQMRYQDPADFTYVLVYCLGVDVEEHLRLKIAVEGEEVVVRGTISAVSGSVDLTDARIEFA
jgi:hypothetical protein